jgi:hypothetical protein
MVFNATFNNISVILVEETGVPIENQKPAATHWQTWSHNVVSTDYITTTDNYEQNIFYKETIYQL